MKLNINIRGGKSMNQFKELKKGSVNDVEETILKEWKEKDILNLTIENRKDAEPYVFHDGPATANGMPGLHHMLAKFLKDTFCKYQTMKGKKVLRKVGWDTHGLPVEVQVEKELGFHDKNDIEAYGIEKFNQKCRESVFENEKAFTDLTERMGQFIDVKHPYVTYKNDYIETEWWILKNMFDEGYIYEGLKIVPYCTRCGTGLASHEVAQGYKEIKVETVTVPMKVVGEENTYFLVWTTTPWTLIANVALCVNPKETYVKVDSKGYHFIVAEKLASHVFKDEYEVLETYQGTELEHMEYEQLLPFLNVNKKAFYVTLADYVTMDDGTGIVHIAPAFGQDDYEVGRKYDLPVLNPVGEDGCYKEGPWKGTNVFTVDPEIITWLKANDKLFKKERMEHNYPHCWRCDTPLLYYSKPSWYIEVTKMKDLIVENNKKIQWNPEFIGEKRFGNWLENLNDWAISRSRYWGTPLPLWICECGHKEMIGSRQELVEKVVEPIDETVELHRPYVDHLHIQCQHCGKEMSRVPDVIDCWFDSGSMPFSQYHYPFENKELFKEQFPADFICEGVDQTRGWFYSLLVISSFVMKQSPYKNVLVHDLLLDKFGKKMSKSKGNIVRPFDIMKQYGADTIRFYFPYASPVWTPLKFDEEGLKEVYSKFFNTLKNTYSFFALYANTDEVDPRKFQVDVKERAFIDQWLLSKYERLVQDVTTNYDAFDLTKVVRSLTTFVNEDLSNWYIRRNRRRFWGSELNLDKKAVYLTTYEVLVGLMKLIAPIVPYVSEEIYQNLTGESSVHLADFPVCNQDLIHPEIEEKMDLVRDLIRLGRNAREEAKIKVRQPISEVILDGKNESTIGELSSLIEEELNVKKVVYQSQLSEFMNFIVLPNYKVAGPIFGPEIKKFAQSLTELSTDQILSLQNEENIDLTVEGVSYSISSDMVVIRITAKEGFNVQMEQNQFIILDTDLTVELIEEGIARELVSKVQNMRKSKGFEVADRIQLFYQADQDVTEAINHYESFIMEETLSVALLCTNDLEETIDLNGHEVKIDVKKI